MNKEKILELVEKDFITLRNLEGSIIYILSSRKGAYYQRKIMHGAFRRACDIMYKRRKKIAKMLGLKFTILADPLPRRANRSKRKRVRKPKRKPRKSSFIKIVRSD